ncbi:uncharacterized protein LOC110914233 [Helianthus annuus]|uniref:uncharacterized protein LOC110914233 n=1 Tax=Helianthus annuus TaxID=4232 RepID=UPI001652F21B|nr:uncharacterized protein LOC110914233 [Helianthus annuus]
MGKKTTRDSVEHFCFGICQLYEKRYLRNPTWNDLQKIYEVPLEKHGIPDMIDSLDCRQWHWYNCPTSWRGQHTRGDQKGPTLVLQAVWIVVEARNFADGGLDDGENEEEEGENDDDDED